MRVLIVEDTESVRFALRLAIEHLGHEVVGLGCYGEQALQEYDRTHPQVVLMDVRMPLIDGLKCTEMIAQQDPNARIVIVTGGRTTESDARQAGARSLLEKPFGLDHLNELVCAAGAAV